METVQWLFLDPNSYFASVEQPLRSELRGKPVGVVLINAPSGDYVFCVITKNEQDTSWKHENEGFVLLRNVSRLLWKFFEPTLIWAPAPGAERWWK